MASHWRVTCFAALALLCCLARREAEAQKGGNQQPYMPNPMNPNPGFQKPSDPQKPSRPETPPFQWPGIPKNPVVSPQGNTFPGSQNPSDPQKPSPPGNPPFQWPGFPQNPVQFPYSDQSMSQFPQRQTSKVPSKRPQTPGTPTPKSCEVASASRVPCGVSGITAAECTDRDCCFDGQSCYFGKGVTVQCTKDGQFIVVVARDVTLPNIDLETISLLEGGQGCTHVDSNSVFAIYHFPVTACGTVIMEEPGAIIYENRMTSSYEVGVGPFGAITRDSSYELLFQCKYIGTSVETLVVEVVSGDPPLPVAALGPIRVALRLANGQCLTKGCNEVEAAYNSYFMDSDYPVTKVLRDPVYVEVQLLEKTDPALVLTLGRCWATIGPNPHSLPQWDILIDGCPYSDDRYLSSLVPVGSSSGLEFPSHYRRFIFKMFTFVNTHTMEPLRENVYIHCSTSVCVSGQGINCEPSCRKRDTAAAEQWNAQPKIVVSSGEMIMTAPQE
uniref:Zona pellucida sperm-binding protein 4 n=1 Tax=Cyprinodon variegatus TaxID=28743 RepID=A0A3Q2FKU6_CYPVA